MARSGSWPFLSERDYANGSSQEVTIRRLRTKLSDYEKENNYLHSQLLRLHEEKNKLHIDNLNLIEKGKDNLEQILILDRRNNELMLQQEAVGNQAANLQKDLEKSEREKREISQDLAMWLQAYKTIDESKKEIEKHMNQFKEATARDRNEIENKTLEEFSLLTQQLGAMKHQLKAAEDVSKEVKAFRIEKSKMKVKISKLTKQNFALERDRDRLQLCLDSEKERNLHIQNEIDDLYKQKCLSVARGSTSKEIFKFSAHDSRASSTQRTSFNDNPARTPPPFFLSQEVHERCSSIASKRQDDGYQEDPLDWYIHLSVKAVKIRFRNVDVSEEKLIEQAKGVPFHRVHDVLSRYMEAKLKRQLKRNQDSVRQGSSVQKTSIIDKVRGILGCGVYLERDNSGINIDSPSWVKLAHA